MKCISPLDIEGILIGHATNESAATGCTAIICPKGAVGAADVRGGGPATRETDLLRPENMVQQITAVMLSGGSAFGLDAASGAMKWLAEHDMGFQTAGGVVPIVCAASLFDLTCGEAAHPDASMGYAACEDAARRAAAGNTALPCGCVGAGTGATVGKAAGPARMMKSGIGIAGFEVDGIQVAAIVAVNAAGTVFDAAGQPLAGVLAEDGSAPLSLADNDDAFVSGLQAMFAATDAMYGATPENTTIGCVVTNAALTKAQLAKVATMAHDGYARAIRPVHTSGDGDSVFAMATGAIPASQDLVGMLAANACEAAIHNAVISAKSACGYKAACDL